MNALVKPPKPGELLSVEKACTFLAQAMKVDEVKRVRDQAQAIQVYYRQRKAGLAAYNDAAEIVLRSERRIGELSSSLPKAAGGRGKTGPKAGPVTPKKVALAAEGLTKQEASRFEKLARIPERKFEQHIASVRARGERITTTGAIAAVSHVEGYDGDEFGTPVEILDAARKVMGRIHTDPATNPAAQKRVRAVVFYTKKDNGLTKRWEREVWLNPPFSIGKEFVAKLLAEIDAGNVTQAILLLNSDTSTNYFHELVARGFEFCATQGRRAFLGPDGKPVEGNRAGQVIFYMGKNRAAFRREFKRFGTILKEAA